MCFPCNCHLNLTPYSPKMVQSARIIKYEEQGPLFSEHWANTTLKKKYQQPCLRPFLSDAWNLHITYANAAKRTELAENVEGQYLVPAHMTACRTSIPPPATDTDYKIGCIIFTMPVFGTRTGWLKMQPPSFCSSLLSLKHRTDPNRRIFIASPRP